MMIMKSYWRFLLVIAAMAQWTACRKSKTEPHPPSGRPSGRVLIVDADRNGAIVLDGSARAALGIRRDGTTEWRLPLERDTPLPVGCLRRCPDAVFSGSGASINSASAADPAPLLVTGGRTRPLVLEGPKRNVLTAREANDLVLATGGGGRFWLELRRGSAIERVPVGGHRTSWRQSADGARALAITYREGGNEARWFARGSDGWHPAGARPAVVSASSSCVRPDGERALLVGQRPATLDGAGITRSFTDLASAGTCAWSGAGGIVVGLSLTQAGPRSRVRIFDGEGGVVGRLDTAGEVTVAGHPAAARVAYALGDVVHEIDTRTGRELRAVPGTRAARYDGDGDLVVAWSRGGLAWLAAGGERI
jgi:hypothetical protein